MVYRLVSKTNEGFLHEGSTPSSPTLLSGVQVNLADPLEGRRLKHSPKTDSLLAHT